MPSTLHQECATGIYQIAGYGPGYVEIQQRTIERVSHNIVLLPDRLIHRWSVATCVSELSAAEFETLATLPVELILIGTGSILQFPTPPQLAPVYRANIGVEIMDTPAACRTYNMLSIDGRKVAAALLIAPISTS